MTTLIAQHTIHGAISEPLLDSKGEALRDERGRQRRRQIEPKMIAPGEHFDPAEIGIDDNEAKSLIASGAARERGNLEPAAASPAVDLTRHPPAGADDLPSDDELEAMTRAQLDDLAHRRGVDISKVKNKGDVIDALIASVG